MSVPLWQILSYERSPEGVFSPPVLLQEVPFQAAHRAAKALCRSLPGPEGELPANVVEIRAKEADPARIGGRYWRVTQPKTIWDPKQGLVTLQVTEARRYQGSLRDLYR